MLVAGSGDRAIAGLDVLRGLRRLARRLIGRPQALGTTLVVPVPDVEAIYERWSGDGARLGVPGLEPHVTILYPFLPASAIDARVEREIQAVASASDPFDYTIAELGRFPQVLYLAPSPSEPFVDLTEALHRRWPAHPPYGGVFAEVIPHITLALGDEPPHLARAVEPALPIKAAARELVLLEASESGQWLERRRFALGRR